MKLFLASEAKHPTSLNNLKEFVNGFKGKRIAYIPTAANGQGYGSWKQGGSIAAVQTLGATVDVIELEDSTYSDVIKRIGHPDIIWFAGGMPGYLLYWMRRVELDKALPEILDHGTVYVGSSAGSMVCSSTQSVNEWYIGESEPGGHLLPGLGLIDFEIYPHYENNLLDLIKSHWNQGQLYLLKNGEAIIKNGEVVRVLGEERLLSCP
jgi:peptidase E